MSDKPFVARSTAIAARVLGDETLVMSAGDSTLFTLDPVATLIWESVDGVTSCAAPKGSPWVAASTAPLWLQPDQSFTVTVTFNRTGSAGVTYTPTVLAGSGGQ